jgi:hypothetical protein
METQFKNMVLASTFLQWYLDNDAIRTLGHMVSSGLEDDGKFSISAEELYDQCGYIPKSICVDNKDADKDIDYKVEYVPSEVKLVNDLNTDNTHPYDMVINQINSLNQELKDGNIDDRRFVIEVIGLSKHLQILKLM